MEIDAPTQPAGELGGCLRRPVCAPARRTARGLSWSTLAYFCVIVTCVLGAGRNSLENGYGRSTEQKFFALARGQGGCKPRSP